MAPSETELVHTFTVPVERDHVSYVAVVRARQLDEGTWEAWLEFIPVSRGPAILQTGRETTQSNLEELLYWASGLEPIYLEGALGRAVPVVRQRLSPSDALTAESGRRSHPHH